ncbi:MAG: tetratricopeptide repeat protein [Elusimicrobiota bacterium]
MKKNVRIVLLSIFVLTFPGQYCAGVDVDTPELVQAAVGYANTGQYAKAIEEFKKVVEKDPGNFQATLGLGIVYTHTGEYALAQKFLELAVAAQVESLAARYSLALVYDKNGNWQQAAEQWLKVAGLTKDKKTRELAEKHYNQAKFEAEQTKPGQK